MESLRKNDTWDLVAFLDGRKTIGSKWSFKKKIYVVGHVEKFKARVVAKGIRKSKESTLVIFSLMLKK